MDIKKILIMISLLVVLIAGCKEAKIIEEVSEVPEIVSEPPVVPSNQDQNDGLPVPEPVEEVEVDSVVEQQSYVINIVGDTFEPNELMIKVGDTVSWKNMRDGAIKKAIIKGTKTCVYLKGPQLLPGESFSWTFEKPGKCEYIEAITSLYIGTIIIEE